MVVYNSIRIFKNILYQFTILWDLGVVKRHIILVFKTHHYSYLALYNCTLKNTNIKYTTYHALLC